MAESILATFDNPSAAEGARAELLERGAQAGDITLAMEPADVHAHEETDYDLYSGLLDGAAVGLFVAFLEGLGTVFVPGSGWIVLGAGAATTLTGAAVGAAAGVRRQAAARHTVARAYRAPVERLVRFSMTVPSGELDRQAVAEILARHGARDIRS